MILLRRLSALIMQRSIFLPALWQIRLLVVGTVENGLCMFGVIGEGVVGLMGYLTCDPWSSGKGNSEQVIQIVPWHLNDSLA